MGNDKGLWVCEWVEVKGRKKGLFVRFRELWLKLLFCDWDDVFGCVEIVVCW